MRPRFLRRLAYDTECGQVPRRPANIEEPLATFRRSRFSAAEMFGVGGWTLNRQSPNSLDAGPWRLLGVVTVNFRPVSASNTPICSGRACVSWVGGSVGIRVSWCDHSLSIAGVLSGGGGAVSRGERPLDAGDGVLLSLAADLRRLRDKAGRPSYRVLSARAHYSVATL